MVGLPTLIYARSQACPITFGRAKFTTCPPSDEEKEKEDRQDKVVSEGLEGFVDWMYPTVNESAEEREAEMSSLTMDLLCG